MTKESFESCAKQFMLSQCVHEDQSAKLCWNCTMIAFKGTWLAACAWQRELDAKVAENCKPHGDNMHDTQQYCDGYEISVKDVTAAIRAAGGGE